MKAGQWITLAGYALMCGFSFAAGWLGRDDLGNLIGFGIYAAIVAVILLRTWDTPTATPPPDDANHTDVV